MNLCYFCTDLHGHIDRYEKLIENVKKNKPDMVFLGGDLLPHGFAIKEGIEDFFDDFLQPTFIQLKEEMGNDYPEIYLILGNDDARITEGDFLKAENLGLWHYSHRKVLISGKIIIIGYAYIPPTPFMLKDWERYDVSRYVDPGCIHPLEGNFSVPPPEGDIEYQTIQQDLTELTAGQNPKKTIMLFHSPPYQTNLDRAALDGKIIDHVPLDVHVGSIAIKRLIDKQQPMITLHGHIHESSRLTGIWHEYLGNTLAVNGSWDGPELALISFDPEDPASINRKLI